MSGLIKLNNLLARLAYLLGTVIVAIMVLALSLSAITRYISGTGYDWLIELPPILVCWLVFPLLGPLLKEGSHIQVDFLSGYLTSRKMQVLKVFIYFSALLSAFVFFKAGLDATLLYFRLGQLMALELDIPIWWMYLSFPVGFFILLLFALELTISSISELISPMSKVR